MLRIFLIFIFSSLFAQIPLLAKPQTNNAGKIGIAVLDFRQRTLTDQVATMRRELSEELIEGLSRIKGTYIVEREALSPFMKELGLSETGAIDPLAQQDFGKALSADLLIEGSILKRGDLWIVRFSGYDVRERKTAFEGSAEGRDPKTLDLVAGISGKVKTWMRSRAINPGAQGTDPAILRTIGVFDFVHPTDPLLGLTIRTMMATEAFRIRGTGLVERENLDVILKELWLQQSGVIDPATRVELGRILGATWIIYGEVEDSEADGLLLSIKAAETATGRIILARQYQGPRVEVRNNLKKFSDKLADLLGERLKRDSTDSVEESGLFVGRSEEGPHGALWKGTERGMLKRVADLKRAIFLDPFTAKAYLELADVFSDMYRYEEARMVLHSLISRLSPSRLTPYELGYAYFKLGVLDWRLVDCENAISHYRRGIDTGALGYLEENSRLFIGRAYLFLGRDQEALEAYRSMKSSGHDDGRDLQIAYILERLGKFDEASPIYKEQAQKWISHGYEEATGFENINPVDRLSVIGRVKTAPRIAYKMLLDAELETLRHHHVSWEKGDKFLKDNYDILNRALPGDRVDAYRDAHMTNHLLNAIKILESLLREHPRDPVVPDALWLLAECHRQRSNSDYRVDISADVLPLYLRIADEYPDFRLAEKSLALASSFAKTPDDKRRLLQKRINTPRTSKKDRQHAILTLAHLLKNEFGKKDEALVLYRRFLEEREWMVGQGATWLHSINEAEGGIRVIETGSYKLSLDKEVRENLKNLSFTSAGFAFQNPPHRKYEEAAWAYWSGFQFGERKADNLQWFARTLEHLGIYTEAIRRYQQVIDLYLETRGDLAESAQTQITRLFKLEKDTAKDAERYAELKRKFTRMDEQYRDVLPPSKNEPVAD